MSDKKEDKIKELENALAAQKERIFELKAELNAAEKEISKYKSKSDQMSKALINAVNKADEIEFLAFQKYKMEMAQLKSFHDRWMGHYNKIITKYPLDSDLKSLADFNQKMKDIISGTGTKNSTDTIANKVQKVENEPIATVVPKVVTNHQNMAEDNYNRENQRLGKVPNKNFDEIVSNLSKFDDILEPITKIKSYMDRDERASSLDNKTITKNVSNGSDIDDNACSKNKSIASDIFQSENVLPNKPVEYQNKTIILDYQEAQNPKQKLEDIMKELGLMQE